MLVDPSAKLSGCKVLIVDDDTVTAAVFSRMLEPEGYIITCAESGEAALAQCVLFNPDLIVLDVRLPGIDGFETCRQIQRRFGPESPPIIFVTSSERPDDICAAFASGGVDYLTKPVLRREAVARIKTHLSNRLLVKALGEAVLHRNRLLGMAAHDLRNPLASTLGMAEFLCEGVMGPLTSEQAEAVAMIRDVGRNMLALVNNLLDVAVVEGGVLNLARGLCNLTELVSKLVHLNNLTAASKRTTIILVPGSPVIATIDISKIRQVADNLLTNAVKYSPLGSTIRVTVERKDRNCVITVCDQGPGIPENERSNLFKDFGTLSVQSTGGEKSTGLGLAISRRIVEAHRGLIAAKNVPGGGCEFSVTLPIDGGASLDTAA